MMQRDSALPGLGYAAGVAALALCAVVAAQLAAGAYAADMGTTGDQSAHYVTALMRRDYVAGALGANPMRFAIDYYEHFPRVALGHWPPLFHATAAMVALTLGRAVAVQIAFQAVILAALCAATAVLVARRHGRLAGAAAGWWCLPTRW